MGLFKYAIKNSGVKDWIAVVTSIVIIIVTVYAGFTDIKDNRMRSKKNKSRITELEKDAAVNQANFDNLSKKLDKIDKKIDKIIEREISK